MMFYLFLFESAKIKKRQQTTDNGQHIFQIFRFHDTRPCASTRETHFSIHNSQFIIILIMHYEFKKI